MRSEELTGWPMLKGYESYHKNRDSHKKEEFHAIHHRKRWNGDLL